MRYVGGKTRIAKWVQEHVLTAAKGRTRYVEPFVGSGAVFAKCAPAFEQAIAADAHPDLILMWQAIAAGWLPPEHVTKDEYAALKASAPSALRGYVGFGASFSGKWFGGYVDTAWDSHWNRYTKPYLKAARDSILKLAPIFTRSKIVCVDYRDHVADANTVFYCDPPYAETLGYGGTSFDSKEFWATAAKWSEAGALVVVSESVAPPEWKPLALRERKAMLRVTVGEANEVRQEGLYVPVGLRT